MQKNMTIVSASSAEFFHFIQGMILSVKDKPQGKDIPLSVFDLGLTTEQKSWMSHYVDAIVEPAWEYGFSEKDGLSLPFKGIFARPRMRTYFPGYDVYMYVDADAWIQDWRAVENYTRGALTSALAITPEIHRAYSSNYSSSREFRSFVYDVYLKTRGKEYAEKYGFFPIFNTGVFSMQASSPLWDMWSESIQESLKHTKHHCVEQASLNIAVFDNFDSFHYDSPDKQNIQLLPATNNWLCHQCLPKYDQDNCLLVEPYLPYETIGIIHRSSDEFKDKKSGTVYRLDNVEQVMNLKYKEGVYDTDLQCEETSKLSDWQGRGGKKF
jgi:hypothetical protein